MGSSVEVLFAQAIPTGPVGIIRKIFIAVMEFFRVHLNPMKFDSHWVCWLRLSQTRIWEVELAIPAHCG